jgi:integrase
MGWTEIDLEDASADIAWRLVRRTGIGLLRLPSTKSGEKGERMVPLPAWGVAMLRRRRAVIGRHIEPVFPDSLGGWRDPSNVRRVWREVRDELSMEDVVSHMLRKTVASYLDNKVTTRKISDQLGHARVSMTQDHYLGRRLTDRETAVGAKTVRKKSRKAPGPRQARVTTLATCADVAPSGDRTLNPRIPEPWW